MSTPTETTEKVVEQCSWNVGGDPVSGCDDIAVLDGLCKKHLEVFRMMTDWYY